MIGYTTRGGTTSGREVRVRLPLRCGWLRPRGGSRKSATAPRPRVGTTTDVYMIGSGSLARSAAPTMPALLPSWAAITSATGRQLPPTSQRL